MTHRRLAQVLAGSFLGLFVALLIVRGRASAGPAPGEEFLLPSPLPAPDFELVSSTGQPTRLSELTGGRTVVLFFGYTNCPDICPITLSAIGRARQLMGRDGDKVLGVMVSVDPERDTPQVLGEYMKRFPPGLVGLTGSQDQIAAAMKGYLASAEHAQHGGATDPYMVSHTGRSFVVHDGGVPMTFPPDAGAQAIADGLTLLLRR
jgi:protein SCO1